MERLSVYEALFYRCAETSPEAYISPLCTPRFSHDFRFFQRPTATCTTHTSRITTRIHERRKVTKYCSVHGSCSSPDSQHTHPSSRTRSIQPTEPQSCATMGTCSRSLDPEFRGSSLPHRTCFRSWRCGQYVSTRQVDEKTRMMSLIGPGHRI
jgi:hypothetical protein